MRTRFYRQAMTMNPVEEKLRLLKPILPPRQWEYLRLRYASEKDFRKRFELENLMDLLLARNVPGLQMEQILLPPPVEELLSGDYPIGRVCYPNSPSAIFGIREKEWIKHCGIFGKTGSGKTTLMVKILRELCLKDKPFLIFDYKRNYRDLLKHPDFEKSDILIFTVGRKDVVPFQFNPKAGPEGVEDYVWIKQLSQIIEKVYLLGPGANDVFMESAGLGTFKEMQDKVLKQKKKARELLWWASVKRTLNAINYPGLGEVVNCRQGYPIPDLLNRKVILELDGLSDSDQAFIIGSLLLWIYHYRMRQPEREVLKHFIIIEEAHHLFLQTRKEEDIADILMREIRELGEAIIVIDQHPSKMSVSALGNLSTKFALTLSLNQDVAALANAMLLGKDEKRYLSMLILGQCVCRSDRFPWPILLTIENYPIQKGTVTDEDLKTWMAGYLKDLRPEYLPTAKPGTIYGIQNQETLSPLGRIILENIELRPFIGFVKRFKDLGLKIPDGYRVIEELTAMQLVTPLTIDGNRLYEVTQKGRQMLGRKAVHQGRGGLEHRYYIEKIKEHYLGNEGFTFLEKDDIDIVIERGETTLAIQMETGKSDIHANLIKLGRYEADLKYVLATNRETEIRLREILKEYLLPDRENIQVAFVRDFLQSPPTL
ncbi:MAG: helicase HerA domain-containing protein [Syntrophales bacterium]